MLKKENFIFLLFSVISMLIGIVSTYLLSNYFTVEDFGKVQLLLTFVGVFSIFGLSGFDVVIQKQIYNKDDGFVYYLLKNIMPLSLMLLTLVVFIILLCIEEDYYLILSAFLISSFNLFDRTSAILNSKLKFKIIRYIELITKVVFFGVVVVSVYIGVNAPNYIFIYTTVGMSIVLFRIIYSKSLLTIKSKPNINYKYLISGGISTTFSSSFTVFTNYSEKLVLGYLDTSQLAIFTIAQLFPRVLKDNIKIVLSPTLNTWASRGFKYYKTMIRKNEAILWGVGILFYIILYFMVDFFISNFFVKYTDSILISQLLSITIIFKFVESVKMSSMALSDHTPVFNKINNISNTLKILLVTFLVNIYGIYGAVATILIVEVVRFLFMTKEFNRL
ncbi:oligosaccharide flippase family protein [Vibrio sp. DW001]|uniref:oligosaccharide flippase family protein n=1 Tax=Vibrio sp. DW001 TaxID=2912315 RepID=UPI0023B14B56|nr:oligosaccharide flippase family protein [Vibrio sp. DW001]WED26874.1 oligosaccharide flippase family protein [Vibrio sp. DW001]